MNHINEFLKQSDSILNERYMRGVKSIYLERNTNIRNRMKINKNEENGNACYHFCIHIDRDTPEYF